jgi:succinate dehydrogenase/fumarate reductase flavoprotein subunit
MNKTMSENCFIFRNEGQLQKAVDELLEIRKAFDENVYVMDKSKTFNTDLVNTMETDFLIDAAMCVANGALSRKESRGAQARTDFPERDDEKWMVHTLAWRQDGQNPRLDYSRKVTITKWQPQVRTY